MQTGWIWVIWRDLIIDISEETGRDCNKALWEATYTESWVSFSLQSYFLGKFSFWNSITLQLLCLPVFYQLCRIFTNLSCINLNYFTYIQLETNKFSLKPSFPHKLMQTMNPSVWKCCRTLNLIFVTTWLFLNVDSLFPDYVKFPS